MCDTPYSHLSRAFFSVDSQIQIQSIPTVFLDLGIKRKEKEMRILMVGLDNSGKTTIVLKINGEDTSVISPTLGFNIKTITYDKYTLNIWDVGGQRTIRSYWRNYFEQTDGLVWVVDSSDLRRLDDCKFELHNLLKEERLSGASLLILANKQDIQGALSPDEIAKVLNLEGLDKTRHWEIVGCSAYTGAGMWLRRRLAGNCIAIAMVGVGFSMNQRGSNGKLVTAAVKRENSPCDHVCHRLLPFLCDSLSLSSELLVRLSPYILIQGNALALRFICLVLRFCRQR
ncbi:hypothetical protein Vadar_034361 [Vaccinium darrowii]|uniref:Uncharacterized protein n=1 Tax=Vaccinium darrowii TaxID=229202 RepID=A0ACB7YK30_9ERIC|nr:hypothetical protein Vadar_034361 [Vaccinium darrowii]